jgi:hypothetical protein
LSSESAPSVASPAACANCGAPGVARYCAQCGQRSEPHIHSLWGFIAEATESLTHADSRVWRTLFALLLRPGFLTVEFLRGRRASYLPPFRLYLVISLAFFVVLSLGSERSGELAVTARPSEPAQPACKQLTYEGPGQSWLQPRLDAACARLAKDGGQALSRELLHNLPRAMFVFLPLLAALMTLLYWRPPRFYVEHLLFLVHSQSAAYLIGTLGLAVDRVAPRGELARYVTWASLLYLVWYFYAALRRVYGNGTTRSLAKLAVIGLAYLVGGVLMLAATALVSAFAL